MGHAEYDPGFAERCPWNAGRLQRRQCRGAEQARELQQRQRLHVPAVTITRTPRDAPTGNFDIGDEKATDYAAYAQGDYHFTDRRTGTLGGRYTIENRDFSYHGVWGGGTARHSRPAPAAIRRSRISAIPATRPGTPSRRNTVSPTSSRRIFSAMAASGRRSSAARRCSACAASLGGAATKRLAQNNRSFWCSFFQKAAKTPPFL